MLSGIGMVSRMVVSKSGSTSEDCKRVKSIWVGDRARACSCSRSCSDRWGSGSVAVDADVDEEVELLSPPSVVIESARSRVDDEVEDVGFCCPPAASVARTGAETERVASCRLMPF
jgi:hypothetical protein